MIKQVSFAFIVFSALASVHAQSTTTSSASQRAPTAIQSLEVVESAVQLFVLDEQLLDQNANVKVKPLDHRLRLAHCDFPLNTNWSPGSRRIGRVTVEVSCSSPKTWRLRVQATVTRDGQVWTLQRGVQRGDVLTQDLLARREITLGAGNSPATYGEPIGNIDQWLGFIFTQRVTTGKVLTERMLKIPRLIAKGEAVVIRHSSRGLQLQTRGVALKDASARQQTQVRNSSSGKIIDVVAVSPGIVEILQ